MKSLPLIACILLAACSSSPLPTAPSSASTSNVLAASEARNGASVSGNLEIAFTKWVTTPTGAMAGVVSLNNTLGQFVGQVNSRDLSTMAWRSSRLPTRSQWAGRASRQKWTASRINRDAAC